MTWDELLSIDPHELLALPETLQRDFPPCRLDASITIGMAAYGNFNTTLFALRALLASASGDFELILVDDNSPDETGLLFEQVAHVHRNTRVFRFPRNFEYSGSLNTVLSHSRGNRIIFLSNDIFVTPAYLGQLLAVSEQMPEAGIVRGCSNFVDNGLATHNIGECGSLNSFQDLFSLARERAVRFDGITCDDQFLTGDAFLISRDMLAAVGYLDPDLFGYFADHDLGIRARQAGYKPQLALGAFAWHEHGANIDYLSADDREQKVRVRWARVNENWARFKQKYGLPASMPYEGVRRIPWDGLAGQDSDPEQVMPPVDHSLYCVPPLLTLEWYRHRATRMAVRARCVLNEARLDEAEGICRAALLFDPENIDALTVLGTIQVYQWRLKAALRTFRSVLKIDPTHVKARSNLLLAMNYDESFPQHRHLQESMKWGAVNCRGVSAGFLRTNRRSRIRIAYASPDFREHSVSYFFLPLLEHHDHSRYEIFCISDVTRPDHVTARMAALADGWRDISKLSHEEAIQCIREVAPDVLIDLAGHTGQIIRLPLFCHRLAPVQAHWLGYPNTTGATAMDFRFTDAIADPPGGAADQCSERLVRLPGSFLCYSPPTQAPQPVSPPILSKGYVTFGSFNMLPKIQNQAIAAWCRILESVPGSRLVLKNHFLADKATARRVLARFTRHGVAKDRITLMGSRPDTTSHLACYGDIDIALDTFPYNGTTTTCEALWMGVPVVTVRGERHAGRVGASILSAVGLSELIAESVDEYVQRCVMLAGQSEYLESLRQGLRQKIKDSGFCDGHTFARTMETTIQNLLQDVVR